MELERNVVVKIVEILEAVSQLLLTGLGCRCFGDLGAVEVPDTPPRNRAFASR